jgi:NADH:ubiquinone oxidoreductase subunit K
MTMVPLQFYLALAAALFCIGLYAVLARRNAVAVLMGVVLMFNAVTVNLVAFWRYRELATVSGQAFALFTYAVAVAEVAAGLALLVVLWRSHRTVVLDDVDSLKG